MVTHVVKCDAEMFDASERGEKPFEVRINDRFYQKGDYLILERWNARRTVYEPGPPLIKKLIWRVTCVLQGGHYGIEAGYCVLGLDRIRDERPALNPDKFANVYGSDELPLAPPAPADRTPPETPARKDDDLDDNIPF